MRVRGDLEPSTLEIGHAVHDRRRVRYVQPDGECGRRETAVPGSRAKEKYLLPRGSDPPADHLRKYPRHPGPAGEYEGFGPDFRAAGRGDRLKPGVAGGGDDRLF